MIRHRYIWQKLNTKCQGFHLICQQQHDSISDMEIYVAYSFPTMTWVKGRETITPSVQLYKGLQKYVHYNEVLFCIFYYCWGKEYRCWLEQGLCYRRFVISRFHRIWKEEKQISSKHQIEPEITIIRSPLLQTDIQYHGNTYFDSKNLRKVYPTTKWSVNTGAGCKLELKR